MDCDVAVVGAGTTTGGRCWARRAGRSPTCCPRSGGSSRIWTSRTSGTARTARYRSGVAGPDAETPLQQAFLGAAAILLRSGIGPAVDLEALGVERSSTATGAVIRITFALLVPRPRGEAAAVTRRVAR